MTCSKAENRQTFLACKAIFTGPSASLRKTKTIQTPITAHQAALSTSIPNFEVNRVTDIVQALLKEQVFQSDIKAKMEFPDLFTPSLTKNVKDNVFGAEAARSAADTLEEIVFAHEKDSERMQVPPMPLSAELQAPDKARVQVDADSKDTFYDQTPLLWAARNGHDGVVKMLLETSKVDADSKDKYGQTPLSWAAKKRHDGVVKLLRNHQQREL